MTEQPSRRSLALMLLATALGAVLVLTAAARPWAHGVVGGLAGGGALQVSVTGSTVSGLPGGLALVGLAAAVAVFAVRGVGRVVVGALLALAGLGVVAGAVGGAGDSAALNAEAAQKLALASTRAEQISHTAWPWVALAGGLLLLAGVLTLRSGRSWPAMGARYEAPTRKAKPVSSTPADLWKALDEGQDPTA